MSMRTHILHLTTAALLSAGVATAQSGRPVAFTNATIHTVSGDVVERGTLVVRSGKIEAVGADVTIPAGAKVVDASGKTIMPGLVSAWSRAGMSAPRQRGNTPTRGGRRFRGRMQRSSSGGRAANKAATRVVDGLYVRQPIFHDLLEVGVTSLALNPSGGGFPGLGAVLNPAGKTRSELTQDDEAFVQIGMQRNAAAKKLLKDTFAKAKKIVEEREKPPAPPKKEEPKKDAAKKPAEAKPDAKKPEAGAAEKKPAEKKPDGKEPEKKPDSKEPAKQDPKKAPAKPAAKPKPKPKDPNLEVLADLLQGKRRAIVQIDSAADLLHWQQAVQDDVKFPRMVAVQRHDTRSGTVDMVVDHLKKWDCAVLLPPALSTKPSSSYLIHPAKILHDAGVEVGFAIGDSTGSVRGLFYNLMELVRAGLPADVAIKAVTHVPAKALGIDKRVGTLEEGKDADMLVFDGDPLSPTGKLEQVWLRGQQVEKN